MRPWYLDPAVGLGAPGFGALPDAYAQAIATLQPLAAIADPTLPQSGMVPGQVAYAIDTLSQLVSQFSSGDAQIVQSNSCYQTLLSQEQAVIANGDYTTSPQHATQNYYLSKGGYDYPTLGQCAAKLMPVLQGLTGSVTPPSFNPTPNGTFVPTPIVTSRGGGVRAVGPAPIVTGGSLATMPTGVSPPLVNAGPLPASGPSYDPNTGVTTGNTSSVPGIAPDPNAPAPPYQVQNPGMVPTTGGAYVTPPSGQTTVSTPAGPVTVPVGPPTSTTDPSTGATTTVTTNPDGSVTASSDGGHGGQPTSVTYPPVTIVFLPHSREGRGHLVKALAFGAIGVGVLALLANSKEGSKIVADVGKPIDAVVTPVTNVVGDAVDAVSPFGGATENPMSRRRRKKIAAARKAARQFERNVPRKKQRVKKAPANRAKAGRGAIIRHLKARGYSDAQIKRSMRNY